MKLDEIPKDRNWKRRALTVPGWFLMATILPLSLPVLVPIAALYDILRGRELSATRTLFFFTFFFVLESWGLLSALWIWIRRPMGDELAYQMANRRLQRWWARGLFWGIIRVFSMKITIDGLEQLEDPHPAVILCRHVSTLDTMMPLAIVRELKLYRYVIKAELLSDPALDFCGQRFPNVFVRRGSSDPELEIQKVLALSQDLEHGGAVMVYPEGTRFSPKKRQRLLEKFSDDPASLTVAERLKYTLPPLREGALRLLEHTPAADVVFIAHRGIDRASAMSSLITGAMTKATLEIDIWRIPAADVPRDPAKVREFLLENWMRIDRFVGHVHGEETTARA